MGVEIVTQPQRLFIRTFSLIAALLLITAPSLTASAYELIIGTGPDGSFSHHNGKLLCRLFTRQDSEMTCLLSESTDQIDNLTNVQGGSLDLALVDSLLLEEATSGRGAFEFLDISYDQIRILTPLYQVPLTLIVRGDVEVTTIDQLPGTRINAGAFGSPENQLFRLFMRSQGWQEEMFPIFAQLSSSMSQDKLAFRQGDVQVLVHRGVHPDDHIVKLMQDTEASLLGFANEGVVELITATPSLSRQELQKSTYPSLSENLSTFGTTMTLVGSADADDETIRTLITALEQNIQALQALHPSLSGFTIDRKATWFGSIKTHRAVTD